jgi:hypothetical protein
MGGYTRDEDAEMIAMLERVLRLEKEWERAQEAERRQQRAQFTSLPSQEAMEARGEGSP